jgi:hypothetical protein
MFDWYKKKRLKEQVEFFGGTQKRFVSCYAKQVKPRIKIKLKKGTNLLSGNMNSLNNITLLQQANHVSLANSMAEANILAAQQATARGCAFQV